MSAVRPPSMHSRFWAVEGMRATMRARLAQATAEQARADKAAAREARGGLSKRAYVRAQKAMAAGPAHSCARCGEGFDHAPVVDDIEAHYMGAAARTWCSQDCLISDAEDANEALHHP